MVLARRPESRRSSFSRIRPTKWLPREIRKPTAFPFEYFTSSEAREFIATKLEEGNPVEVMSLANPPGKIGYVMKIRLGDEIPLLYVKLELGSGIVYGRSFHYSDYF